MKELDFDELDKAVTSLMGSVPAMDETVKPGDDVKTLVLTPSRPLSTDGLTPAPALTLPATPADNSAAIPTPTPSNPVPSAPVSPAIVPSAEPVATSLVSPAARRAGRFMDVVHPSSDMTKATASVSRHAGTIEPLSSGFTMPVTPVAPSEPATDSQDTPEEQHDTPDLSHHATSDWPDPLDMQHASSAEPERPVVPDMQPAPTEDSAPSPSESLSSPFLPDAKVEKRPLGGAPVDATPSAAEAMQPAETPTPASDPQTVPTDIVLPEELQDDLMAIESRQAETVAAPAPVAMPVVRPVPATPTQPQPSGPTSIQQQYKAEQSTGDQTNGSIYDTDSYHKPLEHPAKKKSSAALIIWIVVLLIIGAGGGAAAYFYLLK